MINALEPKYARQPKATTKSRPCIAAAGGSTNGGTQNVEDRRSGRSTYRPSSYNELIDDASQAVLAGLQDGLTRMEVEFPAVSNVDGKNNRKKKQQQNNTVYHSSP